MYINTTKFNFEDPDLGIERWKTYWYTWASYYLPLLIYGLTLNFFLITPKPQLFRKEVHGTPIFRVSVARTATVKPPWMGLWRPEKWVSRAPDYFLNFRGNQKFF